MTPYVIRYICFSSFKYKKDTFFSGTVYSDDRNHFWKLHHFHIYSISTFNIQVSKANFFQVSIFFHEPISFPGFLGAFGGLFCLFLVFFWLLVDFSNIMNQEASKKPSRSSSPERKGRKSVHEKNYQLEKDWLYSKIISKVR